MDPGPSVWGTGNQTAFWPRRPPVDTRNGALEAPFGTHWPYYYYYIFISTFIYLYIKFSLDQCGANGLPLDPGLGVWGDGKPNCVLAPPAPC